MKRKIQTNRLLHCTCMWSVKKNSCLLLTGESSILILYIHTHLFTYLQTNTSIMHSFYLSFAPMVLHKLNVYYIIASGSGDQCVYIHSNHIRFTLLNEFLSVFVLSSVQKAGCWFSFEMTSERRIGSEITFDWIINRSTCSTRRIKSQKKKINHNKNRKKILINWSEFVQTKINTSYFSPHFIEKINRI